MRLISLPAVRADRRIESKTIPSMLTTFTVSPLDERITIWPLVGILLNSMVLPVVTSLSMKSRS